MKFKQTKEWWDLVRQEIIMNDLLGIWPERSKNMKKYYEQYKDTHKICIIDNVVYIGDFMIPVILLHHVKGGKKHGNSKNR